MKDHHVYIASCCPEGGVYHYTFAGGRPLFVEKTPMDQPMYLDARTGNLLALLRQPDKNSSHSALVSYTLDAEGRLREAGAPVSTRGVVACHLCRWQGEVYAANYLSGSVFGTNGALDVHKGSGPNPQRQDAPHTHYIAPAPDGFCLLSADLGLDAVYSYDRQLRVLGMAHVPAGHGARHLAASEDGKAVFCANELIPTVTAFSYHKGQLSPLQTVSLLESPAESYAAAIRVRGDYVYVSNRGDDSISCLRWDGQRLRLCSVTPCGGCWPRDFIIVDDTLWVANERSDHVTVFHVDGPEITPLKIELPIPVPLCVAALPAGKER